MSTKWFRLSLISVLLLQGTSVLALDPMTTDPAARVLQRGVLHRLMPFREKDEPMFAKEHGTMTPREEEIFLQSANENYFAAMDHGLTLPQNQQALQVFLNNYMPGISREEATERLVRGRNTWLVWSGGNDRFWNYMTRATFGTLDFLKTVSDNALLPSNRSTRWQLQGLVNEPCFEQTMKPNAERFGLYLPKRSTQCPPDPFEDERKYPGVRVGSRGTPLKYKGQTIRFPVGSMYGYASGIVGLRLFPNPDFDQKAADQWNPERYYSDVSYYENPNLIRPYRVGMACALCHVSPSPTSPPKDFSNPRWENLSSNPGAQYFWVDRVFAWDFSKKGQDNFIYQLLHTARPGTLDTSLISSDMINNPRTMNAVYDLPSRVALAMKMNHRESLKGNETLNAQFSDPGLVPATSPLRKLFDANTNQVLSPRVLKDGSDAVGALGALNRVFVNIGLFGEEWVQNFIPLVGGIAVTPFRIDVAQKGSLNWQSTVKQTPDLALFFLASSRPDKLAAAPGGAAYLQDYNSPQVTLGKKVFAQNCARCHSSILPEAAYSFFNKPANPLACVGANYMNCWNAYWEYSKTDAFKQAMEKIALQDNFLVNNYLSTELRVPITLTDSQLCSPIGTNAIRGNVWDNFSSDSYKNLPRVDEATKTSFRASYPSPTGGMTSEIVPVPGGGRGFLRPPSLISVWSTAPFLQNNSLGKFDWHGTVKGRMDSFNDSINQLLNPETRISSFEPGKIPVQYVTSFGDTLPGVMDVLMNDSYLKLPKGYLPKLIWDMLKKAVDSQPEAGILYGKGVAFEPVTTMEDSPRKIASEEEPKKNFIQRMIASIFSSEPATLDENTTANYSNEEMNEFIRLGPLPAGVPVNLIANLDLEVNSPEKLIALGEALTDLVKAIVEIRHDHLSGEAARAKFMAVASPALVKGSRCKDFVVNRGHYFGTQFAPDNKERGNPGLSADEKSALIEFIKHF